MIQYIIKIHKVKIQNVSLIQWIGVIFLFVCGSKSYFTTIAYLASEGVVLQHGCQLYILPS